jgi:hypothetical protein
MYDAIDPFATRDDPDSFVITGPSLLFSQESPPVYFL